MELDPIKSRPIEICGGAGLDLAPDTINPDWVLEGDPKIRCSWWSGGSDGVDNNYVWDCTSGRFRWYFGCDETVHIISGEVEVSCDGVAPTWLRAGDSALFRAGSWATWHVPTYVRKHAVLRTNLPWPLRQQIHYGRRAKNLVRRLLGRQAAQAGGFAPPV
jgi:uncharacterized cupin superfamily protein